MPHFATTLESEVELRTASPQAVYEETDLWPCERGFLGRVNFLAMPSSLKPSRTGDSDRILSYIVLLEMIVGML